MKKSYLFLALLLCMPLAGMAAQTQSSYTLLSFDLGYGPVYDLSNKNSNEIIQTFGLNVRVADPLSVGIALYSGFDGSNNLSILKLKYDVLPSVRAAFGFGFVAGPNTNYTGLGIELVPFRRQISGLSTEFKLATDYFFEPNKVGEGSLSLGLLLSVGF